jgi:hypothetical protein
MGSANCAWTPDRHEVSLFADRALAKSGTRPHHSGGRGADQLQHLLGFHAHLFLWGAPSTPVYVAVPPLFTGVRGRKILGSSLLIWPHLWSLHNYWCYARRRLRSVR